jgi:hypothetical protein
VLGHHWQPGTGTVVDVRFSGHTGNAGGYGQIPHFLMDIHPSDGAPFRTEVELLPLMFDFRMPAVGSTVQVECDPERQKAKFVRSDPAISTKSADQAAKQQYQAEAQAGPVSRTPLQVAHTVVNLSPDTAPPAAADPHERLARLTALHADGTLTDDEYEQRRAQIIAEL